MADKRNDSRETPDPVEHRRQAEAKLRERKKKTGPLLASEADLRLLMHELEVHQIELEMQNEELIRAQAESEAALDQYTALYDFAPVGYFTLTRVGTILQVNLTGANLLGVERSKLLEKRFSLFVAEEFRTAFIDFLEGVFECGEKESFEVALREEGGEPRWVQIEAICLADEQECRAAVTDITESKKAENALRASEERLSLALTATNQGLYDLSAQPNGEEWSSL